MPGMQVIQHSSDPENTDTLLSASWNSLESGARMARADLEQRRTMGSVR